MVVFFVVEVEAELVVTPLDIVFEFILRLDQVRLLQFIPEIAMC